MYQVMIESLSQTMVYMMLGVMKCLIYVIGVGKLSEIKMYYKAEENADASKV